MSYIHHKITLLREIKVSIEEALTEGELEKAKLRLEEYSIIAKDANYFSLQANYFYLSGKYNNAIKALEQGLIVSPFNFELNLNMGIMHQVKGSVLESLKYFTKAMKYSYSKENNNIAVEYFDNGINSLKNKTSKVDNIKLKMKLEECKKILNEIDNRHFPIDINGESVARKVLEKGTDQEYMVNMYKSYNVVNINRENRFYFSTELFKGKEIKEQLEINLDGPTMIPISLIKENTNVEFRLNGSKHLFKENDLWPNKYHYIRFNEKGKLKIKADSEMFIGNPIKLNNNSKTPRLILNIFVDGLSYQFLENEGIEKIMPNTYAFFKEGFVARNCYATSEWTLPSVASIFTGKYTTSHRLFHPSFNYRFEDHNKLLSEHLHDEGYFTTQICNNWRITPTYGYHKGFDRILYKNFLGGMGAGEVIMEAIEHIETFKEKNNFVWICLEDLHHVPDEIEDNLYSQVNTDVQYRVNRNKKGPTTVLTTFDENKIVKYREEIKRLDVYLGILFDYIAKQYSQDEVLVLFKSDHGQSFLEDDQGILHESRRKVPLMITGKNVPMMESDEIIETVDILPITLKLCGGECPSDIDGVLPMSFGGTEGKKYAFTQAIHPNQTYKAVISDETHIFRFETHKNVGDDGSIDLEEYQITLLNRHSNKDETSLLSEKVNLFESIVFEHAKSFLRLPK